MNIYQITGRNVEVTEAMHDYVEQKLSRLDRFNGQITDARVTLTVREVRDQTRRNRVEVQMHVPGGIIRAEEHNADMYAAIDKASDVLERQLRKFKTKNMRDRNETLEFEPEFIATQPAPQEATTQYTHPEIVRQKRFDMRPMTAEDAAVQLEALGHDFYVFKNLQGHTGVVYRRKDGHYGLIEAN